MGLNPARLKELVNGMSSIQRKVYDVVPNSSWWSVGQIAAELARSSSPVETRTLMFCLGHLVEAGVVRETQGGGAKFMKAPVRTKQEKPLNTNPTVPQRAEPETAAPTTKRTSADPIENTLEKLSRLSERVRDLSTELARIASEMDNAALAATDTMSSLAEDTNKLRQLQSILSSIR